MTHRPAPFAEVDFDTWRARVEKDGRSLAALRHAGLEGVELEPLYDRLPARPLPVPPRARAQWACLQALPREPARAAAVAHRLVDVQIDGVWIEGSDAAAIAGTVSAGLAVFAESDAAPVGTPAAWGSDPWRPVAADVAGHTEAALARAVDRSTRTWFCDGAAWHDAGATAVDEVAIVLAGALGAIRRLSDRGVSADQAAGRLLLRVGLGGDVLVDVAKLRALRSLWHGCATQLGIAPGAVPLHARTARRVRSRRDVDTNLVRATYELFAAATAGADALVVEPHDRGSVADDGAYRWARNLAHLMRHESRLDVVDDPFGGSWAVESLTRALGERAWARVQELERQGGLAQALVDGSLVRTVEAAAEQRRAAIAAGTHPIVGVSKYPPPDRGAPTDGATVDGALDLCAPYEGGDR